MKNCANCGQSLNDDELFCPVCGTKAPENSGPEAETAVEKAGEVSAEAVPPAPAEVTADAFEDDKATAVTDGPVVWDNPVPPADGGFCPACGAPLERDALFCPVCGGAVNAASAGASAPAPAAAAVSTAPAAVKEKKKLNPKYVGMIATAAVAVVVIALAAWLISGLLGGPNSKFVAHHEKMVASLADKELGNVVESFNRLSTLSTDMTLTARAKETPGMEAGQASVINAVLDDSAVKVKVDMNKTAAKVGGELVLNGESRLSGTAVYDKGKVGFQIPEMEDTYFTADLTELVETLTGERIEGLNALEIPQIPEKSLEKAVKTYLGVVSKAVTKDNVTTEKDSFRLDRLPGKRVEGTAYIYQPEAEDIEAMLEALADALDQDKDLHNLVNDFLGGNKELINTALLESGEDTLDDLLDDGLSELADEIGRNAADAGEAVEDSGFTWTLWVGKGNVYKGELATENSSSRICYERTDNGFALWTEYGDDYETNIVTIEYEKDGKLYNGTYSIGDGGATMEFRDVDTSKESILGTYYGEYSFTQYDSELCTMEVEKGETGGTDHIITFGDFSNDYSYNSYYDSAMSEVLANMEIVLNTTDKKSTLSTPKGPEEDVSYYDAEDFAEVFAGLQGVLEEIGQDFAADDYSYYD